MTKKAIQVADLEFQDMRNNERVVLDDLGLERPLAPDFIRFSDTDDVLEDREEIVMKALDRRGFASDNLCRYDSYLEEKICSNIDERERYHGADCLEVPYESLEEKIRGNEDRIREVNGVFDSDNLTSNILERGIPDLLVWGMWNDEYSFDTFFVEVKSIDGGLRRSQVDWINKYPFLDVFVCFVDDEVKVVDEEDLEYLKRKYRNLLEFFECDWEGFE